LYLYLTDREPIYHDHIPPPSSGHGFYEPDEKMTLRWNSRVGLRILV
jgi:NAD+ kinase